MRNVPHGGSGNALQGDLRLLDAKHQERDRAGVDDGLGEVGGVLRDVTDGPRRGLFDGGVEFLEARHEGVQRAGVHDGLREVRECFATARSTNAAAFFTKRFCSESEYTSCGRISLPTTASARSSE